VQVQEKLCTNACMYICAYTVICMHAYAYVHHHDANIVAALAYHDQIKASAPSFHHACEDAYGMYSCHVIDIMIIYTCMTSIFIHDQRALTANTISARGN
jgi:hypothetical protein